MDKSTGGKDSSLLLLLGFSERFGRVDNDNWACVSVTIFYKETREILCYKNLNQKQTSVNGHSIWLSFNLIGSSDWFDCSTYWSSLKRKKQRILLLHSFNWII